MKITLTVNNIDSSTMGSWDGYEESEVVSAYAKFVCEDFGEEIRALYPKAKVFVEYVSNNLSLKPYQLNIEEANFEEQSEAEEKIEIQLKYSDVWDRFCKGEFKKFLA